MTNLRKSFILLALALFVSGLASPASAQGFRWWKSEKFQKELSLTADQIAKLEAINQAAEPTLRAQKAAFDKCEQKLTKVISDPKSDESQVIQATERLDASRAELNKTRTLQLFRMRRILTDEQNAKMKEIHDRDRTDHGRPRGSEPPKQEPTRP